jgi:hypothetical protein
VRLRVADEAGIAGCFSTLVDEFPDVAAGCYPGCVAGQEDTVSISVEAKDEEQVVAVVTRLQELLDEHPDPEMRAATSVIGVLTDVDSLTPAIATPL